MIIHLLILILMPLFSHQSLAASMMQKSFYGEQCSKSLQPVTLKRIYETNFNRFCNPDSKTYGICTHMHHLKSLTKLLDSQRELLQIKYSYMETLGSNIEHNVQWLFENGEDVHLSELETISNLNQQMIQEARQKNPLTFSTSNKIYPLCQKCHPSTNPSSGHSWEEISRYDWTYIYNRCNENSYVRNPYSCKNMYGLFSVLQYFETATYAKDSDFSSIAENAEEMIRIATDLIEKKMIHGIIGSEDGLQKVRDSAIEVKQLALEKNIKSLEKANGIIQDCQKCHLVLSTSLKVK